MNKIIAKVVGRKNNKVEEISTNEVVLDALCAYRDELIKSGKYNKPVVAAKLTILYKEIDSIANQIKV